MCCKRHLNIKVKKHHHRKETEKNLESGKKVKKKYQIYVYGKKSYGKFFLFKFFIYSLRQYMNFGVRKLNFWYLFNWLYWDDYMTRTRIGFYCNGCRGHSNIYVNAALQTTKAIKSFVYPYLGTVLFHI